MLVRPEHVAQVMSIEGASYLGATKRFNEATWTACAPRELWEKKPSGIKITTALA